MTTAPEVAPIEDPADRRLALGADGLLRVFNEAGVLEAKVDPATLRARTPAAYTSVQHGFGRELFSHMRAAVGPAEAGASVLF